MNPIDPYSTQDPSSPTDATARIGRGDQDRAAETASAGYSGGKTKRAASQTLGQAREKIAQAAGQGKAAAAGRLGGYSDRLRATARSAEQEDPNIAHFAAQAADRLQEVADYVREADFSRLRQDAAGVAHRHPTLFMGGMLVAGLVLGNLAKASVQTLREDAVDQSDGPDDHYSEETNRVPGETPGRVSDSFDADPREDDPRL